MNKTRDQPHPTETVQDKKERRAACAFHFVWFYAYNTNEQIMDKQHAQANKYKQTNYRRTCNVLSRGGSNHDNQGRANVASHLGAAGSVPLKAMIMAH